MPSPVTFEPGELAQCLDSIKTRVLNGEPLPTKLEALLLTYYLECCSPDVSLSEVFPDA